MASTTDYSAPVDLQTFLQRHSSRLPSTVKLVEGFCGTNAEDTLEGDQILIIYKVEKQNTIIALDQLNQELCVPRNTKNKVQVLPFDHHEEHKRVQHLFNARQTEYFRVLEDLASLQITSETTLQLLSNQPLPNFAKCKVVDLYDSREVFLPLELEGRFQPLLDAREYYLEEVLAQYQLPVNIRFVLPSRANDGACFSHPLSSLKNIHLEHEAEVEMIFAASVDDPLSLNLFPRTLGINVRFGFKVTADTSRKIKQCRQTLAASERALKRLDKIASNSFYYKVCPVRRFNFESLQPPSISVPQTTKERVAILSKAKQNKTAEQTAIDRELRHVECPQSASISGLSFEENAADYENCETDESFNNSLITEARKAEEEGADAVPVLPPKLSTRISRSTQSKDTTRANEQSRPVPKPRKRRNSAKNGNQENDNNSVSQPHSQDTNFPEWAGMSCGDDGEDTCPELPPRPAFLKIRSIEDNEDDDVPRERPPALPPRCPGPNQFGFPAYLVVDVTDWRAVDEKALGANAVVDEELYSDAKDDGQVFKQDSVRHLDLSLMCPPDEGKAYIDMQRPGAKGRPYVDMESHEKMDMDGGQSGRENFHKEDFIQPDETGISEELENSVLPNASTENIDEAARHHEEESSDEDCSYEEIEEQDEPSQRENRRKESTENQEKTKVERPSKNPWSKATHGSCDTRPSRATIVNGQMNLRDVKISGHRDDDWMDFREIEHFLKLRKQLQEALSKKADLEKQVALTRQNLASKSQTQQPPTFHHTGNETPHMDKADFLDENHNSFDSSRNSQRDTQAATKCESVSLKKGDDHETEMSKKPSLSLLEADESENKQPSLSSLAPVFPGNVSSNQKRSLTSVKERDDSEDDDDYEECYDREYINQQTGVNYSFENVSSEKEFRDHHVNAERQQAGNDLEDAADVLYYNTEELETHTDRSFTSPYLQLDNPNDEEEIVNTQKSDKGLATINAEGNQPALFRAITAEIETFIATKFACEGPPNALDCIEEPPPLPPKKGASSLRDAE